MAITEVDFIKFHKLLGDAGFTDAKRVEFAKWVLAREAPPQLTIAWPEQPDPTALDLLQHSMAQVRLGRPDSWGTLGQQRLDLVREPVVLQELVDNLDALELSVVILWFGITGEKLKTFKVIAERLGIPASKASRLHSRATTNLRDGLARIDVTRSWEQQGSWPLYRPILMLEIDQGIKDLLSHAGIHNVGDLMHNKRLREIKDYGPAKHRQVQAALKQLGLTLPDL